MKENAAIFLRKDALVILKVILKILDHGTKNYIAKYCQPVSILKFHRLNVNTFHFLTINHFHRLIVCALSRSWRRMSSSKKLDLNK